jgi:hypothetical protein
MGDDYGLPEHSVLLRYWKGLGLSGTGVRLVVAWPPHTVRKTLHYDKWLHHGIGESKPHVVSAANSFQNLPPSLLAKLLQVTRKTWHVVLLSHYNVHGTADRRGRKITEFVGFCQRAGEQHMTKQVILACTVSGSYIGG